MWHTLHPSTHPRVCCVYDTTSYAGCVCVCKTICVTKTLFRREHAFRVCAPRAIRQTIALLVFKYIWVFIQLYSLCVRVWGTCIWKWANERILKSHIYTCWCVCVCVPHWAMAVIGIRRGGGCVMRVGGRTNAIWIWWSSWQFCAFKKGSGSDPKVKEKYFKVTNNCKRVIHCLGLIVETLHPYTVGLRGQTIWLYICASLPFRRHCARHASIAAMASPFVSKAARLRRPCVCSIHSSRANCTHTSVQR